MKKIIGIVLACFLYTTSTFGVTLDFYHLWPKGGPTISDDCLGDATQSFEAENSDIQIRSAFYSRYQ